MQPIENTTFNNLIDQVSFDLQSALVSFQDEKIGLRMLSSRMSVHSKTLVRIIQKKNKPGYQTLYKIYRVLTSSLNDTQLMELVPPLVHDALKKGNPKKINSDIIFSRDIEREILSDKCFAEIYFMSACSPLSKEYIAFRFGEHGMETMRRMLKLEVLSLTNKGTLILGKNQANLGPESIKTLGLNLVETFSRPEATDEPGENFMGIYAEGLNEEAYKKWIDIDEKAYKEKVAIANDPTNKGQIRSLTFVVTDKMQKGRNK